MSSITELATTVRNAAGEHPMFYSEHNPRFVARIQTEQGTTLKVSCPGDQASIQALAQRLDKGEGLRKRTLRHPLPLPSRVNLSVSFSEVTFRELSRESPPVNAVEYAKAAGRSIAFNRAGEPMLVLDRPACLEPFPDLVLVVDGRGEYYANRYAVIHLHSGLWVGLPKTSAIKKDAIAAMESRRKQQGDQGIHAVMRQNYDPEFQCRQWEQFERRAEQ